MRNPAPINLVVHFPQDAQGRAELAERVARLHADVICGKLAQADFAVEQKLELIDAVKQIRREKMKR